jgi:hypothetical protein
METSEQPKRFPKLLNMIWWFVYLPVAVLEAELLYEQTWLTYTKGEQMIGFTMAHRFVELVLFGFAGWLGCVLWSIVVVLILGRRHQISTVTRIQFALAVIALLYPFVPIDRLVLRLR